MTSAAKRVRRVLILGAAGRDFHDFNVVYRDDPGVRVVAFTAAQIPGIAGRRYPASLAGPLYPGGIPIEDESRLEEICRRERVDEVVFAYSDVTHEHVMHLASRALASGADFALLGPERTWLRAEVPVIAISAVRTGSGKSQTARWLGARLRARGLDPAAEDRRPSADARRTARGLEPRREDAPPSADARRTARGLEPGAGDRAPSAGTRRTARGLRVAVVRHPMPYGDLERQRLQRFATLADVEAAGCSAEEREEYEPHLAVGNLVFAGVDYAAILERAQREADVLIWDGGNNDFPFLRPDLHLVIADALRPGHALRHHPGETVLRMADVVVVNKVDAASVRDVERVVDEVRGANPRARIVRAASPVRLDDPAAVRGRRVLVVEDGPTLTHGGMSHGAGFVAATRAGAAAIVDPRDSAPPALRALFARHPHIGRVLPAVGYDAEGIAALRETIERSEAEVVVAATPCDLAALLGTRKPTVRARYEYADAGEPTLGGIVDEFLAAR